MVEGIQRPQVDRLLLEGVHDALHLIFELLELLRLFIVFANIAREAMLSSVDIMRRWTTQSEIFLRHQHLLGVRLDLLDGVQVAATEQNIWRSSVSLFIRLERVGQQALAVPAWCFVNAITCDHLSWVSVVRLALSTTFPHTLEESSRRHLVGILAPALVERE